MLRRGVGDAVLVFNAEDGEWAGRITALRKDRCRIALEAQARGHELFFYTPDKLAFDEGRVIARGWPIDLRRELGNHVTYGEETAKSLTLIPSAAALDNRDAWLSEWNAKVGQ